MAFLKQLLKLRDANLAENDPPVGINDRYVVPAQPGITEQFPGSGREVSPLQAQLAPLADAPLEPTAAAPMAQRPASQNIMEQIQGIQNKDYSKAKYDESGNIIKPAGADRDKKWSLGEKVLGVVSGILEGVGSGRGLIGGAAKGIQYGTDRNFSEKQGDIRELQTLGGQYNQAAADEEFQNKQAGVITNTANARLKPIFQQQQIDLNKTKVENQFLKDQENLARLLKEEEGRNQRAGMQTKTEEVDGYLFRTYPNDPSKPMEPIIDPRTGKQAFNPSNVAQEVTFDDGTKAWAKGGQIVQGKFAGDRQAKDIEYKEKRDTEDRKVQLQKIQTDIEQSTRQHNLELEKLKRGGQTDKRLLDQLKAGIATRRAWIMANKNLSPDEKQALLAALPNDNVVNASAEAVPNQ